MANGQERSQLRFPPSQEEYSHVEREQVDETCPDCASSEIAEYPTLRFKGWFRITRCQECFHTLQEEEMMVNGIWEPWTWDWNK